MKKKKSFLRRLIPWLITLALLAALVIFVGIPLYSQVETEIANPPVISYYEGDDKPLKYPLMFDCKNCEMAILK